MAYLTSPKRESSRGSRTRVGEETLQQLAALVEAQAGDLVMLLGVDSAPTRIQSLDEASGWLRLELARKLEVDQVRTVWKFAWIVDFPMFAV